MQADRCTDRRILAVSGADRAAFLQGLVTNDVERLRDGAVYAAMLTPQGKYMADFLLVAEDERILIDVKDSLADALAQRLAMYKLRSKVVIEETGLPVWRGLGAAPAGAVADPRDPALGWRYYGALEVEPAGIDWDALRVDACIPESGVELQPGDSFILETGFERLNGVDFRKGCYVGQEVTARMKHKTALRKGLARVIVEGSAPAGTPVEANGKSAGTLYTQAGGRGLAFLRFDRMKDGGVAGEAEIRMEEA